MAYQNNRGGSHSERPRREITVGQNKVKVSLITVQGGKEYMEVAQRLVWFHSDHPDWGIETDPIAIDVERQYAIFRCRIYNADGKLMGTGTKMENRAGFDDYVEKAETGSIGRALALCGYGTQFAPELDEGDRLADSPQVSARPSVVAGEGVQAMQVVETDTCSCGESLTKSQVALSRRNYGQALCPTCQKNAQKVAA